MTKEIRGEPAGSSVIAQSFRIDAVAMRKMIDCVVPCRDQDPAPLHKSLKGTLLEFADGKMIAVATDGLGLSFFETEIVCDEAEIYKGAVVIDPAPLQKLRSRLIKNVKVVNVRLYATEGKPKHVTRAEFSWTTGENNPKRAEKTARCDVIEGYFPNWRMAIPKDIFYRGTLRFSPTEWVSVWNYYTPLLGFEQHQNTVRLAWGPTPSLACEAVSGVWLDLVLDQNRLMRYLSTCSGSQATMRYYGSGRPIGIECDGVTYFQASGDFS